MYRLDEGRSGPTVRINHMIEALRSEVDLDIIAGRRTERARAMVRYATAGQLDGLAGMYVETSTTVPGPADLAFLGLARRRTAVLSYVRDAYQLFPALWPPASLKSRLSRHLYRPALRLLARASTATAYPSQGLADALRLPGAHVLLPPGAPPPVQVPRESTANRILAVGALRQAALGGDLLLEAIEHVRQAGFPIELVCVTRPGDEPPGPLPPWVHVERAAGSAIHALLPRVFATVIPRRRNAYNDLAIPIKAMDYLSYGRPMLVTDCRETARLVDEAKSGLIVSDTASALADGAMTLFAAGDETLNAYSQAGHAAAAANGWPVRARQLLSALDVLPSEPVA